MNYVFWLFSAAHLTEATAGATVSVDASGRTHAGVALLQVQTKRSQFPAKAPACPDEGKQCTLIVVLQDGSDGSKLAEPYENSAKISYLKGLGQVIFDFGTNKSSECCRASKELMDASGVKIAEFDQPMHAVEAAEETGGPTCPDCPAGQKCYCTDKSCMCITEGTVGSSGPSGDDATDSSACKEKHAPGMHLIKLRDIKRQFLLFVPKEVVKSSGGVPLVMTYHGFSDSPWYSNQAAGVSILLERYGWLGLFPFGLNNLSNGMAGPDACCPPECTGWCCRNGQHLNKKDGTACGWAQGEERYDQDMAFTEAMVEWAGKYTCTDKSKVFATGFSNGATFSNQLGCAKANLFRAVAPMSGDTGVPVGLVSLLPPCKPSRPISYVSVCGSKDDEAKCQYTFEDTAKKWSHMMNCSGAGDKGDVIQMSATTTCTQWRTCADGNFVEYCLTDGLAHDPSGHMRPDNISVIRPGSDLDFPGHVFQKFSLLVNHSILFWGHPTGPELKYKESKWPPPEYHDHMYLRSGRLLGHDRIQNAPIQDHDPTA